MIATIGAAALAFGAALAIGGAGHAAVHTASISTPIAGMSEEEAEGGNATTNGSKIGPDYTQATLASEASGRQAVQLKSQGQYVEFTLTAQANAFDLHYALNQGASGNLSVYVNGSKLGQELSLTSQYSYITTGNITGSQIHHFYNDTRMMFGQTLGAGAKVRVQVDSGDSAAPYTIDVADFFNVAGPISQPSGSVSVTSYGADPTGAQDSSNAFRQALSAANAAGQPVWIPQGTFQVSSAIQAQSGTFQGAGSWYTQLKTNMFIQNNGTVPGPVNLHDFAILGNTVGRHDDSSANAIQGSLGTGAQVSGLWIQNTNVGFWLEFGNTNIKVSGCVVLSTDADGLNFNGNGNGNTVTGNFFRNNGDDGIALWSYPSADSNNTISGNTVVQPNLANGIADYGGSNNTITGNTIADTNPLGSGLAISNEAFIQPLAPLGGTVTVSNNTLIRTGAMNPNWGHPMGAMRFDSYDYDISNVTINVTGNEVDDSPWSAFEIVSGGGTGKPVTGLNFSNDTVNGTGTVIFQVETQGSASVSNVTASNLGDAGVYNSAYPAGSGTFTFNLGSGNSGWATTPVWTTFPPQNGGSAPPPPPPPTNGDLAQGRPVTASTTTSGFPASNAVDGNTGSYWESQDGSFPQTLSVDLQSSQAVGSIVLNLPPSSAWSTRTETLSVSDSPDGSSYSQLVASAGYTFNPSSGNTATISLPGGTTTRFLRLTFTANTGWPAAQVSEFGVYAGGGGTGTPPPPPPNTDLALNASVAASSTTGGFPVSNAVDGNTSSYWESQDGSFPQTLTVDLGSTQSVGRLVLDLPPSSAWNTRTETLSVLDSGNGSSYSTIAGSAGYTFDPSTGNTVTITLPSGTSTRYLRLNFTANTGWPAAQLSELQAFAS
ncbi:MAG TPA: discoidin domain-containing protein [Pseudonocardiaceae bacterium]|nr:discoidin domain-containing protein [Pseudonocardiaceae bacterium]